MKKLLLLPCLMLLCLPLAFSEIVLLTQRLNKCDEYWEVKVIELDEEGDIVKNVTLASGTYDHCSTLAPNGDNTESGTAPPEKLAFKKMTADGISFHLHPNPGTSVRSVHFRAAENLQEATCSVLLLGISGKERAVWKGTLSGKEGTLDNLDFGYLPDGNYYLIFKIKGHKPVTTQLVKYSNTRR